MGQMTVFVLVGLTAFLPAFAGYSYTFYAATPMHRCKLPNYPNDTYEIMSDQHMSLVQKYIPEPDHRDFAHLYDKCQIKSYTAIAHETSPSSSPAADNGTSSFQLVKCNEWVYSREYFGRTLITDIVIETKKKTMHKKDH